MYKALIVSTCKAYGLLRNQAAYVLATVEHETNGTFMPVREAYWVKNAETWRSRNLRYYPWYGRGFVQLTWKANYLEAGEKIGVDLIKDPDAAMQPDHAAKILVLGMVEGWFTGKKLSDYITLQSSEFVSARRIINGTDKDDEIAALAMKYDAELRKAGYGVEPSKPVPQATAPKPSKSPLAPLIAALVALMAAAYAFLKSNGVLP